MITVEEARQAVNTIIDYCDNHGPSCSTCAIKEFCEEQEYNEVLGDRTKYEEKVEKHKYDVTLEIALPAEAATKEEAKKLVEKRVKAAFPDLLPGDCSVEDIWEVDD